MNETDASLSLGMLGPEYAHAMAERYAREFPGTDFATIEVSMKLNSAHAAEESAMGRFFLLRGFEKREARYSVLRILYFSSELKTQNDLRIELGVTSPNITYLIDTMEKEGVVQRAPHPSDRRTGLVELTEKGRELAARLTPAMVEFMERMAHGFTDEEKATFLRLLDKFHRNALSSYLELEDRQA
jgi:DNA-binding MarR family transcriptional regulator